MSEKHGSRTTVGGYQGPRTDAAAPKRGRPTRSGSWVIGPVEISLQIVPLVQGRPELYEVALQTNDPQAKKTVYIPCMVHGQGLAEAAFRLTAEQLDSGTIPDHVLLPPGAPLGW